MDINEFIRPIGVFCYNTENSNHFGYGKCYSNGDNTGWGNGFCDGSPSDEGSGSGFGVGFGFNDERINHNNGAGWFNTDNSYGQRK